MDGSKEETNKFEYLLKTKSTIYWILLRLGIPGDSWFAGMYVVCLSAPSQRQIFFQEESHNAPSQGGGFQKKGLLVGGSWLPWIWHFPINIGNNNPKGLLVGGLEHQFYFPMKILGLCHHPNWRSHIFQRGGPTTKKGLRKTFHKEQTLQDDSHGELPWWFMLENPQKRTVNNGPPICRDLLTLSPVMKSCGFYDSRPPHLVRGVSLLCMIS